MKITRVILFVLVILSPTASRAQSPALPDDVRSALEKNARSLADLEISGTRSRRMLAPAEAALRTMGTLESEPSFTQRVRFELQLQGAKLHESYRYPPSQFHSGKDVEDRSYDGTKHFNGGFDPSRPEKPGVITIKTRTIIEAEDRTKAILGTVFELWYLSEAGFNGPTYASELGRPIESLVLARAAAGRIESVKDVGRDGRKLLEVVIEYPEPWASRSTAPIEKDRFIQNLRGNSRQLQERIERERRQQAGQRRVCRFLLDGEMGYAVREEWESRAKGGAVMFHTKNSDFQQLEPGGAWLPRVCEVTSHAYETAPRYTSPEPMYVTDIRVEKLERKPLGDEQFRVWYNHPGIKVIDWTDPKATLDRPRSYQVASPLEDSDTSHAGFLGARRRWLFVIVLNGLMAAILVLVLYVRSRRLAQWGALPHARGSRDQGRDGVGTHPGPVAR